MCAFISYSIFEKADHFRLFRLQRYSMLRDAGIDKAVDSIYLLIENIVPDRVPAIREALRHELEKSS